MRNRLVCCLVCLPVCCLVSVVRPSACAATLGGIDQGAVDFQSVHTGPGLSLHKEMFMLPATWSPDYKGWQTEAIFQISAKYRLYDTRFYFGFTQISFWQAYDYKNSAPFRDTNYNPELFYRLPTSPLYGGRFGADIGSEHESNGQLVGASRSWNLLYLCPWYQRDGLLLYVKLRYRIPEDEKETPLSPEGDDNPDITDFMGYSDVHLYWQFASRQQIHLMVRGNLATGRGAASLNWSLPMPRTTESFFVVRVSHGYGESLMDYRRSINRVGVGLMFTR